MKAMKEHWDSLDQDEKDRAEYIMQARGPFTPEQWLDIQGTALWQMGQLAKGFRNLGQSIREALPKLQWKGRQK